VFRPYAGGGETFESVEDAREFFARERQTGADVKVSPYSFVERGDSVEVLGWIRLIRSDGGLADSQGRWTYHFKDGEIVEADYVPGAAAALTDKPTRRA
jgi:ketosteroid isomerase-like protein